MPGEKNQPCGSVGIDEKVAFLKRPESYSSRPAVVEAIETHMAWVFLTDRHAFKLKKPVRYDYLDFSTMEARQLDCHREVHLNRRLAPDVYLAVVPLSQDQRGNVQVDGSGIVVDWLVKMRKLPRERMLDRAIGENNVEAEDVWRVGKLLGRFYRCSPPVDMPAVEYRHRLTADISTNVRELNVPSFGLRPESVKRVAESQARFVEDHQELFDARVQEGHVIDAHGDLRPEHVCLTTPPVIIDCLEFNREFRLLDPASELSFLTLECDRLGAPPSIGEMLWSTYCVETGDVVADELRQFYRSYHALTRAKIALWHLRDANVRSPDSWRPKAEEYVALAADSLA